MNAATVVEPTWLRHLIGAPAVSLPELEATAALLRRCDRKYVVSRSQWSEVVADHHDAVRVLEIGGRRHFGYQSTYYDTPDWELYLAAARGRPCRPKVRLRTYLDAGATVAEVKQRDRTGLTHKHRCWIGSTDARSAHLPEEVCRFVVGSGVPDPVARSVRVALHTGYRRSTLLMGRARVTVDHDVIAWDGRGKSVTFGEWLIVETKTDGRPSPADKALWAVGVRPIRLSKYCTSLAALRPELPSHRWARTVRRYLTEPAPGQILKEAS